MEWLPIYFLFTFFEIYSGILILIIVVQLLRRKRLPWKLFLVEAALIGLCFYLRYLTDEKKLIFIGKYNTDKEHWESGMANVMVYMINLCFLIGLFLVTQIVFWIIYSKKFRKLNVKPDEIDLNSFLNSSS